MPVTKTATIERYHVYGTPRHHLRVLYRGLMVRYWQSGACVYLDAPHWFGIDHDELIAEWSQRLKRLGFTHIRFAGEWGQHTKPKGGKL